MVLAHATASVQESAQRRQRGRLVRIAPQIGELDGEMLIGRATHLGGERERRLGEFEPPASG